MNDNKKMMDEEADHVEENGHEEMETDSEYPETHQGEVINDTELDSPESRRRRTKKRVKVKTRVRVKKKSSSSSKYKKLIERLIWIAFIVAFVAALVILYKQLGFNDSKYKSTKRTMLLAPCKQKQLMAMQQLNKQKSNTSVIGI